MISDPAFVERFRKDFDRLAGPEARIGIAVSGGCDSTALLLLAAAVRPGGIEAATVDHGLRAGSAAEAEQVAALCLRLKVPHQILAAEWIEPPATAVQERARNERYRLLGAWGEDRGLEGVATAHHADDQAETLLMRLLRGAGVRGLAGMLPLARLPGGALPLLRPLLGWRHEELESVCAGAGVTPIADPSNADEQYERVRVRKALAQAEWLDAKAIAASASHLAEADAALAWAAEQEWQRAVTEEPDRIHYVPRDMPRELQRRIVSRAVLELASEGVENGLRGREVDQMLETLRQGGTATLRGVLCAGGAEWRFTRSPPRSG